MKVTNSGCSSENSNILEVLFVSVDDLSVSQIVEIFPNPNFDQFQIKVVSGDPIKLNIEIYNNLGALQWIQEKISINGTYITSVDLGSAPAGVYIVALRNKNINLLRKVFKMK